jgi:hypothetical protein
VARRGSPVGKFGGFKLEAEGAEEMARGAGLGAKQIKEVWREIMRGPFGQDFLQELKARTSDRTRTGYTLSRMQVSDYGSDGVSVGIPEDDTGRHPASKYASAKSIGVWIESGTRMHLIPTRVANYNAMNINGNMVARAVHPGTRGIRPVYRTLMVYRKDFERLFIDELDRRLSRKMGLK